jgi:hypothetical protein
LVAALVMATILPAYAQSTTKSLSTNFTLVNLSAIDTSGTIDYYKTDGTAWRSQQTFNLSGNGGQAIFRQYLDPLLTSGQGSVVVGAGEAVGSVVQILARGQNPTTSGAYVGLSTGDTTFYVPLAARKLATVSGLANSQIVIQNTDMAADADVQVDLVGAVSGAIDYTRTTPAIKPGASYLYDLDLESSLPAGWYGSAVVRSTNGKVLAVVSNFFTGDAMQTFNAFSSTSPGTTWYVPLFTSRLSNTLSTVVAFQNLSGGAIDVGQVSLNCTPNPALGGAPFNKQNTTSVPNNGAYYFNPVTDTSFPDAWYGSCVVNAPVNVVVFVQMRFIAAGEAAAYEALRVGNAKVIVPLVAKRLSNGFSTVVNIQNLGGASTNVDLTYTPAPEYVLAGGSPNPILINDVPIGGGQGLQHNHRTIDGVPQLPQGWYGTLVAVSDSQPIAGFVQLTFLREINAALASGDNFMAHTAFAVP